MIELAIIGFFVFFFALLPFKRNEQAKIIKLWVDCFDGFLG